MKNIFNSIPMLKPKSNFFDLSHDVKLSCNMGDIIPVCCIDSVPGDKYNISASSLVRLAPMVAPMMHRCDVYIHYFFVPKRIIWPNWDKFITNTPLTENILPAYPTINVNVDQYSKLADYFGIPLPLTDQQETISAMQFAAYQCIYNEYYRDQNLIDEINYKLADGDNSDEWLKFLSLRKRAWEHDYFTAALPFAQKGAAVNIPMQGDVILKDEWPISNDKPEFEKEGGAGTATGAIDQKSGIIGGYIDVDDSNTPHAYDPAGTLEVQNATTTINDLRRAYALQKWFEAAARGGSRLTEMIYSLFGVKSPDARLQRPEYITGVRSGITVGEVLNTAGVDGSRPQGDMAGHGIGVVSGKWGKYYCQEHGFIIGIMSIMPKTAYQQGIHKQFLKINSPFEHYFPQFANIGEQEVINKEVYAFQGENGSNTFGYVPRYAEYKFEQNRVAGDFRTTLDFWHMGRIFATPPTLSQQFIECDATKRVFAVQDENTDVLWCHVYNQIKANRGMPKFGVPSI